MPLSALSSNRQFTLSDTWLTSELGGLPFTAIHIDQLDNLWIGTQSTLYLLTGTRITTTDQIAGSIGQALSKGVTDIAEDSQTGVYVGTYGSGIVRFDLATGHVLRKSDIGGINISFPEKIFAFNDELLWIVTPDDLVISRAFSEDPSLKELSDRVSTAIGAIHSVDQLEHGLFIAGGERGIATISLGSGEVEARRPPIEPMDSWKRVTASLALNRNEVVFGTDSGHFGIYDYTTSNVTKLNVGKAATKSRILDIEKFENGLAVSTDQGIFVSDTPTSKMQRALPSKFQRGNLFVSSFFVDEEQIWVGTLSGIQLLKDWTSQTLLDTQ